MTEASIREFFTHYQQFFMRALDDDLVSYCSHHAKNMAWTVTRDAEYRRRANASHSSGTARLRLMRRSQARKVYMTKQWIAARSLC